MLDRVIPLNERHLRQLLREYVRYHNEDRIHDALNKMHRMATSGGRPSPAACITSRPPVGCLHHRFRWDIAALTMPVALARGLVFWLRTGRTSACRVWLAPIV